MKKITIILVLPLIFYSVQNAFTQNSKWELSLYGGYSLPTNILEQHQYYDSANKLSGYNIGISTSYYIRKQKDLSLTGSLNFNHLLSTYHYENGIEFDGMADIYLNIVSLDIGIKYKFLPKGKVDPFVDMDLSSNYYTGHTDIFEDFSIDETTYRLKPAFRLGLKLGTGVEIKVSSKIGVIAGYNFNFSNIIGRSINLDYIEGQYSLNDGINSEFYNKGFDIFYSQFYSGISFHL